MKRIAAVILLVASLPVSAQYKMIVNTTDGQKVEFLTSEVESITYGLAEMSVNALEIDTLPSITPREGHVMFYDANGNLVVAGGHTNGFLPTSSVQILKDGEWTNTNSNSNHDMPFSVILSSGKVMIGGGCSSRSGVGQSNNVEIYDPNTGTFSTISGMTVSRTEAHAVELSNGNVAVTGNWYANDLIELYSPESGSFESLSQVSQGRVNPYIFETAENEGIVFGSYDIMGGTYKYDNIKVDRFDGTSFTPAVFSDWTPTYIPVNARAEEMKIDDYTYLIAASNRDNEFAIIKIQGEEFSKIDTDYPIPSTFPGTDKQIYYSNPVVDRNAKVAYILGTTDEEHCVYVTKIDYSPIFNGGKAKVSFSYKDNLEGQISTTTFCITPDGNIAVSGGIYDSNYSPFAGCYILKP